MLKKVVLFLNVFLFTAIVPIDALTSSNMEKLNKEVEIALRLVELKYYEESLNRLEEFTGFSLAATTLKEHNLTVDELQAVSKVYEEAMETLKMETRTHDEKVQSVMKLRLVVDAVQTEHQPLWTEMESQIMLAIDEALVSILEQERSSFHLSIDHLLTQYALIYDSLQIDVDQETMQRLDGRIRYIDQYRANIFEEAGAQKELVLLKEELQATFADWKEDEADPSLWWVIISTGSLIVISLFYTGWRKFVGTRRNQKDKKKMKN